MDPGENVSPGGKGRREGRLFSGEEGSFFSVFFRVLFRGETLSRIETPDGGHEFPRSAPAGREERPVRLIFSPVSPRRPGGAARQGRDSRTSGGTKSRGTPAKPGIPTPTETISSREEEPSRPIPALFKSRAHLKRAQMGGGLDGRQPGALEKGIDECLGLRSLPLSSGAHLIGAQMGRRERISALFKMGLGPERTRAWDLAPPYASPRRPLAKSRRGAP